MFQALLHHHMWPTTVLLAGVIILCCAGIGVAMWSKRRYNREQTLRRRIDEIKNHLNGK
jgi:uncharacterized iron-regulated membrane protein